MEQETRSDIDHPLPTLQESVTAFDDKALAWDDYTHTPLGRLRQDLTTHYMMQHLGTPARSVQVLDIGGGTGGYALPLVQQGHQVCVLDFSAQMLAIARQRAEHIDPGLLERLSFCHAPAQDIAQLFALDHFDLILCHTLLEYVSDPQEILQQAMAVLRPKRLLSLLFVNPYADPLRWAIAKGDLEKARLALTAPTSAADLFGLPRRTWAAENMREMMVELGGNVIAEYGVRVLGDYLGAENLGNPAFTAQLFELETMLGSREPYRRIARYTQFLVRKTNIT